MGQITFLVKHGGIVDIEVGGVEGATCEQITKAFEEALGGEDLEKELRPEYYVETIPAEQHLADEEE